MGLNIQCKHEHLNKEKIKKMWRLIAKEYSHGKDTVTVQELSKNQIQVLNNRYAGVDKPTNVLTFSYSAKEHDISLCLELASKEAQQRDIEMENYIAMLLAHAFLHVVGYDHQDSTHEQEMRELEQKFLGKTGFLAKHL